MVHPSTSALYDRLRLGWVLSALVPVATLAGFLVGPSLSREAGLALLLLAALAEVVSPAVVYSVGFAARDEHVLAPARTVPSSRRLILGRAAVGLHALALVVLAVALAWFTRSTQDPSMAALGFLVGGMFIALLSLAPWLAAVITGGVFATRSLREASA